MPKVSQFECTIDGQDHEIDIFYNRKNKFHVTNFPGQVLDVASPMNESIPTSGFETENRLTKTLLKAIDVYHKKRKKSRKVIVCKFGVSASITRDENGDTKRAFENVGDLHFADNGAAIGISYFVAMEINFDGLHYHHIDENGKVTWEYFPLTEESIVLDWSQKREDSMKEIFSGMESLALKIAKVFTNKDSTAKLLDSGMKLLN